MVSYNVTFRYPYVRCSVLSINMIGIHTLVSVANLVSLTFALVPTNSVVDTAALRTRSACTT
jgi:hypothetical protein